MMKEKQRGRTAQDRKEQIAPQTPKPETKSQHEASRLKPQGRRKADRFRSSNAKIHVCTYNTRTLRTEDDTSRLVEELGNIKWHVVGLCETKRRGEGLRELSGGSWMYETGKTEENPNAKGLALLINKNFTDYVENFEKHSDRIISCKIKLHGKTSLQIIQVHAPTCDHDNETVKLFYEELEKAIDKKTCNHHIVMGDFNAKIGVRNTNDKMICTGPFGTGNRNERGERLLDFAEENNLVVTNSLFFKAANRYWTWEAPGGVTENQRAQRAMERKMLDLKLKDKIPCSEIRKRTKIIDIIEYTLKQKWKWAGHIAGLEDNRWTKRCTAWQPRRGKRSRGRPSRRWQDDITEKEGTTWIRKATDRWQWKTLMEGYILQWMDKA